MSLCNEFTRIPSDQKRKLLPLVVSLYVEKLLEQGDVNTAFNVLLNAKEKGVMNDYLRRLYDYVYNISLLQSWLQSAEIVLNHIGSVPSDFIMKTIEHIEDLLDRLGDRLPSDSREKIERILGLLRDDYNLTRILENSEQTLSKAYGILDNFIEMIKSAGGDLNALENALGYGKDNLPAVIQAIQDVIDQATATHIDNPEMEQALYRIVNKLIDTREMLKGLQKTCSAGTLLIGEIKALGQLLSKYGGTNNLENQSYVNSLEDDIYTILTQVKTLEGIANSTEYPSNVRSLAEQLAEAGKQYLDKLKEQLVQTDPRFLKIFEEAESRAGVSLVKVTPPENPVSQQIDNIVRSIADNSLNAFKSNDLLMKFLGGIALIGSGALDTLTLILRPQALAQQVRAVADIVGQAFHDIVSRNLNGLRRLGVNLFKQMFGTPDRALYTIGTMLGSLLIAEAVKKVPVPARFRAVLTDLLQGDPIGLAISSIDALDLAKTLRVIIRKPKGLEAVIRTEPEGFEKALVKAISDTTAVEKQQAQILARSLTKKLARMYREGVSLEDINNLVKEAIKKHGISELLRDYNKLVSIESSILKESMIKPLEYRLPEITAPSTKLTTWEKITGLPGSFTARSLEKIEELIPELKSFLAKYKDILGEEQYKKMVSELDRVAKELKSGEAGYLRLASKDLLSYEKGLLSLKTLKQELFNDLVDIDPRLAEKIAKASPQELPLVLVELSDKILAKLEPKRLEAINTMLKTLKELENTKLGQLFKNLEDRIYHKIMLEVKQAEIPDMHEYLERLAREIQLDKLPKDIRSIIRHYMNKEKLSLKDMQELAEKLGEKAPELTAKTDVAIVLSLLRALHEKLDKLSKEMKEPWLVAEIKNVDKMIELDIRRLSKAGVTFAEATAVAKAPLTLEQSLADLVSVLRKAKDKHVLRVADRIEEIMKKIHEGKAGKNDWLELYKALTDKHVQRYLDVPVLEKLRNAVDNLLKRKPEYMDALKKLRDIIDKDLERTLKELAKGWGFAEIRIGKETAIIPVKPSPEAIKTLKQLLAEPTLEKTVRINGVEISVRRDFEIKPDGTTILEYTFRLPGDHKGRITLVTRPEYGLMEYLRQKLKHKAVINVYEDIYFDPEFRGMLEKNKALREAILTGKLLQMADPMYKQLTKLRIISTAVPLSLLLQRALTTAVVVQNLPLYNTILRQSLEQLAERLIQRLKPKPVLKLDRKLDLLILYKTMLKQYPVVIAVPLSLEKLREITKGTVLVKLGSKLYEIPVVLLNGQETLLIPLLQLKLALAQKTKTLQKTRLKQVEAEIPEMPQGGEIPSPPSIPVTTAVPPIVPGAGVIGAVLGGKEEKTGKQKEILVI